jgi:hypothetical protein
LKRSNGINPSEQKQPYKEKEVLLILQAAEDLNGGTTGYAKNGKTFRLLIELMLETGMRVSDAVKFDPSGPPLLPDLPLVLIEPAHKHLPNPLTGSKRERIMQQSEKRLRTVGGEESVPPKRAGVCDGVER